MFTHYNFLGSRPHLPTKISPHPNPKFHSTKSCVLFCFVLKNINRHNIKNTNVIGRGTAENAWVPPEGQHQGLHGPPTFPTLEQLRVWTTRSCLGLRPSSSHLRRRWERGLPPPINKYSPQPWQTRTLAQLKLGETTSTAYQQPCPEEERIPHQGWEVRLF